MPQIYGKGHEILSFFNIDYESYIKEITGPLMDNPNTKFKLSLEKISQKTKAPKYIQPTPAKTKT